MPRAAAEKPDTIIVWRWLVFFAVHAGLGLLFDRSGALATAHALLVGGSGVVLAVTTRKPELVAYVGAYIAGSEVMWRMAKASVFWEYGKYATVAVLLMYAIRVRPGRAGKGAIYFLLLVPSAAFTVTQGRDMTTVRQLLSFNLSGPLALMVAYWFFNRMPITRTQLLRILMLMTGPIMGVCAVALFGTVTLTDINFEGGSNPALSGGFGPNQVSSILGLGVVCCFLALMRGNLTRVMRFTLIGAFMVLAVQSALTFSRGGLYTAGAAIVAALLFLARSRKQRVQIAFTSIILASMVFFVFPRIDAFTGGALTRRFTDTQLTGREELAEEDVNLFLENPLLGVGPGLAQGLRDTRVRAAHTEITRLVSEHGLFGLGAFVLLILIAIQNVLSQKDAGGRAMAAALSVWCLVFMLHAAMRLVAPAYCIGLASAYLGVVVAARPRRNPAAGARFPGGLPARRPRELRHVNAPRFSQ